MSAVGLSTVLPDRGQHQHFVIPRAPRKESPPEIINHEFDHTRASLAATGNRAFIMRDTRRGLRMLSSPADPESAAVADQHQTRLSLSKLSGSHSNASEGNLWIIPPNDKGKRRRPERTTAVVEIKLPLQSPIRQVQWWRRPPSPLVSHMRPLWESNAGGDHIMVDLAPPDMKKIPRRAPEEGEEIAEESRHLRRTRGSQPTPTEVSPEPEPEPYAMGTPSSALSVDSSKFFSLRSSAREPRRQGGGGAGGGWSYIAAAIAAANAPPPPTTNAPTAGSFAGEAIEDGSVDGAGGGNSYLEVLEERERSPSRSPESSRPPSVRMIIRQAFPPPPSKSPPPPPGTSKIVGAVGAGREGLKYFAPPGREEAAPSQSFRPVQQHHHHHHALPQAQASSAPSRRVSEGRGRESTGRVGRKTSVTSVGAVDNAYGNDDASRRGYEQKDSAMAAENSGGDVAPEESTTINAPSARRMPSNGNPTVRDGKARYYDGTTDRGRSATRPPPESPTTTSFQKIQEGVTSLDDNGRVSPPPYLEGLAGGSGKSKTASRSGGNAGSNGGGASGNAGGIRNSRPAAVSGCVLSKVPRGGGGGGTLSAPSVSAGLAVAIAEMEKKQKQQHKGGEEDEKVKMATTTSAGAVAAAAAAVNTMTREERRDGGGDTGGGGGNVRGSQGSQGRAEAGAAVREDGQRREDREVGEAGAVQSFRIAYLSDLSSTRTSASLESKVSSQMQVQGEAQGKGQGQGRTASRGFVNGMMISASSEEENESDDGEDGGNEPPSSSVSSFSASTSFTAVSSSTAVTGVSGATGWTLVAPSSEAAPPSTAGPETPQSLLSSDVHGLEAIAPGVPAAAAAPPSPTSSHASSSLRTSMRTRRRRGSGTGFAPGTSKGTRPERESGSSGSGAMSKSSQHLRRGYQRRRTPPSAESPLNVGAGPVRPVSAHSRRRPRVNVVAGGSGMMGVPRQGVVGGGGGGSGGVGNGGGGNSNRTRSMRLDDHGLRHMARGGGDDEAYERHYVNPMNASAGAGSSAGVPDDQKANVHGGALAKLLRRLNVLRKRWRRKRKNDVTNTIASTSSNVSSNGSAGGGGVGGDGEYTSSAASDMEGDRDARVGSKRRPKNGERDGPTDVELEMACRRMLDGLWMSAKRGTETLPISVADGRTLLTGLMAARAGEGGIDLGVPLPISAAAKWNATSRDGKPLRPVVGGASGPFARAGRERDISALSDSGSRRREAAALRRAMELAMGVSQERDSFGRKSSGFTNAPETGSGVGGYYSLAEWSGVSPSDSRHHARRSSTRAKLHRELRKESAAVGLTVGRKGERETGDNSDGGSSRASSVVSSSSKGSSKSYQQQHRVSSRGSHRVGRQRHSGSGESGGSRGSHGSRGSRGSRGGSGVTGFRVEYSDGENERRNRSQSRSGSSSRRGTSHAAVTRTTRANTISGTGVGLDRDRRSKQQQQQQRSSGSRGGNTISAREGLRTVERQIREGSASRSRSQPRSSSSRPVAAGAVVDSTGSGKRGSGRGVPGVSDHGRGDGDGDGGRRSIEQRNQGSSVGSSQRRRPSSQPPRGKGE